MSKVGLAYKDNGLDATPLADSGIDKWLIKRHSGEVVTECTLHNSIILAIFVPKIIKVGGNLMKLWQKQFWLFFWDMVYF